MLPSPTLTHVMTPFPYSVESHQSIVEASLLMEKHEIRHLPVKRGGDLVGIVSRRDMLVASSARGEVAANVEIRVDEVYTPTPHVVEITTPLHEVVHEMANRHIGAALVVKHGKLVGIVTATDACRLLGDILKARSPADDDVA